MGKPVGFKHQMHALQPSGAQYSDNVTGVEPLPIWTDGEQVVSCWQLSWRERIAALLFGRVWLAVLSGKTQPPAFVTATREYFKDDPHA